MTTPAWLDDPYVQRWIAEQLARAPAPTPAQLDEIAQIVRESPETPSTPASRERRVR